MKLREANGYLCQCGQVGRFGAMISGRRKFGINRKKDSDKVLAVMNQSGSMQLLLGLQYTQLINFISFYVLNVHGKL